MQMLLIDQPSPFFRAHTNNRIQSDQSASYRVILSVSVGSEPVSVCKWLDACLEYQLAFQPDYLNGRIEELGELGKADLLQNCQLGWSCSILLKNSEFLGVCFSGKGENILYSL